MKIGRHPVGHRHPPVIVAELSANHNGSLEHALDVVDAVATAGAHVLKLQTYTADTITLDVDRPEFRIDTPGSLWEGRTLYDLYQEGSTPWEWHAPIVERCSERGLDWFSSPFDVTAVDLLEELDAPAYKIASFEIVDIPLIRRVARTGRPVVMSTGMATLEEIDAAVTAAREAGCADLVLLQCTSTYPATPENSNLATIPHLAAGVRLPGGSVGPHARDRGAPGRRRPRRGPDREARDARPLRGRSLDAAFSLEPDELRDLVEGSELAWQAVGDVRYGPLPAERASLEHRRSLYVTEDLKAGDKLTSANLRSIRPAAGLPPRYLDDLLGRRVGRDVPRGTPASWDLLDPA